MTMNRRDALKALVALPAVASVSVADVRPEDVVVIESDLMVSDASRRNIETLVRQAFPDRRCVVLDGGLHMRIARGAGGPSAGSGGGSAAP